MLHYDNIQQTDICPGPCLQLLTLLCGFLRLRCVSFILSGTIGGDAKVSVGQQSLSLTHMQLLKPTCCCTVAWQTYAPFLLQHQPFLFGFHAFTPKLF